jgi:hypothetical protein
VTDVKRIQTTPAADIPDHPAAAETEMPARTAPVEVLAPDTAASPTTPHAHRETSVPSKRPRGIVSHVALGVRQVLRLEGIIPAVFGMAAIVAWLAVFGLGSSVSSAPFRAYANSFAAAGTDGAAFLQIFGQVDVVTWLFACTLATLTFTPSNVALLCCVSALAGDSLRVLFNASGALEHDRPEGEPRKAQNYTTTPLGVGSAVARGFLVYLILISGLLLVTGTPFSSTSPQSYISLAGTSSLFCFLVGFRPALVGSLLDRVTESITGSERRRSAGEPSRPASAAASANGNARSR